MATGTKALFDAVRKLAGGSLDQVQVDAVNATLAAFAQHGDGDHRKLAYILATEKGECNFRPIEEHKQLRTGKPYNVADPVTGARYFGRGLVQLTWKANYVRASKELSLPLTSQPELALRTDVAAQIIVKGMMQGWFTTKRLSQYFSAGVANPLAARRIVNGTDRALEFVGFYNALVAACRSAVLAPTSPVPPPPDIAAPKAPTTTRPAPSAGFFMSATRALGRVFRKAA